MIWLVCVFDLINTRERRDMLTLLLMFAIVVGLMIWTFFNGYPSDSVVIALLGLFVVIWAVQEIEWKRTR